MITIITTTTSSKMFTIVDDCAISHLEHRQHLISILSPFLPCQDTYADAHAAEDMVVNDAASFNAKL